MAALDSNCADVSSLPKNARHCTTAIELEFFKAAATVKCVNLGDLGWRGFLGVIQRSRKSPGFLNLQLRTVPSGCIQSKRCDGDGWYMWNRYVSGQTNPRNVSTKDIIVEAPRFAIAGKFSG